MEPQGTATARATGTVLIADNDPVALKTSIEYFSREEQLNVIPAPNLEAAEVMIEHKKNELDAVILDNRLTSEGDDKDTSGWDLAQRTRAKDTDIPLFVYTKFPPPVELTDRSDPPDKGGPAKIFVVSKDTELPELAGQVREQIAINRGKVEEKKRIRHEMTPVVEDRMVEVSPAWSKQHKALISLMTLLLALVCGFSAVVLGESRLLILAGAFGLIGVVHMALTLK